MNKALVLAGGIPQIELIKELHERGYYVILTDYTEHPIAESYADLFYQESTLDEDAIKKIALNEKVNLVITCCTDQALCTVAKVSEELSLPCYVGKETGLAVTNKHYMKDILWGNNIRTAKYQIAHDICEVWMQDYPLVVKPVDCNSSKGVKRVNCYEELLTTLNDAIQFSRTNTAIIEEYIDGIELSVDVFVHDKKANILCISCNKKIGGNCEFIINKGIYPAQIDNEVLEKIVVISQKIVDVFQLKNCPMLIQLFVKNKEVYVIEFSARSGGCIKYRMIELVSGVNVIKCLVDLVEEKEVNIKPQMYDGMVVSEFVYCDKGIFAELRGFDKCKKENQIESYYLLKSPGHRFNSIQSSGDRVAAMLIVAKTFDEYVSKHNYISKNISVLDKTGNDIMRHDLFELIN